LIFVLGKDFPMTFVDENVTIQRIHKKGRAGKKAKLRESLVLSIDATRLQRETRQASEEDRSGAELENEQHLIDNIKTILLSASQQDVLAKHQAGELLNRFLYIDCPSEEAKRRCKRVITELNGIISRTQIYSLVQFYNAYPRSEIENYLRQSPFLTYSHFRQVMVINDAETRNRLLQMAIEQNLSVRDLVKEMKQYLLENSSQIEGVEDDEEEDGASEISKETAKQFTTVLKSFRSAIKASKKCVTCPDLERLVYAFDDRVLSEFESLMNDMLDVIEIYKRRIYNK